MTSEQSIPLTTTSYLQVPLSLITGVLYIPLNLSTTLYFQVPILFEETFYNNNDESYKVLCVGWPLNTIPKGKVKYDLVLGLI